ncbi:hypothetical protein HYW84_02995 [Candidatus Peregrinibacteria bacterium]|nr:hypothetical protein [Candidatus Peregrinibacteria bacterium]
MERSCTKCGQTFTIHPDEQEFVKKMVFTFGEKTIALPLPKECPDCRLKNRTCYRNEQYLYKVRSAFSGKDIVSIMSEKPVWGEPYKIYDQDEWRSNAWDPLSYGREFDAQRPFFEQFAQLQKSVPRMALITLGNENSGFTTGTGYCKNCYLINSSENCEDCYYGKLLQKCSDSMDCSYLYNSQLCYECFSVYDSYNCQWLSFSANCRDCFFASNLTACSNCCLCTNLNHREYCFMNKPMKKEEYDKRLKEFRGYFERTEQMKEIRRRMMQTMLRKYANIVNCQDCTGDYLENSKHCLDCYDVNESQDSRYVTVGVNVKDNYDCSNMYLKSELCYMTLGTIEVYGSAYCLFVFHSQRLLFCDHCFNCSDCFGCVGLTRKKFCILNKQYSKEEYEELVPKIITNMEKLGEWGQYFPTKYSPFGYNESLASEYFPLSEKEAKAQGFHWREKDARDYKPQTTALADRIDQTTDSVTKEILACKQCTKNYRVIPQELSYYQKQVLPVPHRCPECRHADRLKLRNPRKLWRCKCANCGKDINTTYAPERPEKILCEECYLKEVY